MINIKKDEWEFLEAARRKRTLSQIAKITNNKIYKVQRLFNKVNEAGLIDSEKKGRKRYVKLNKNGFYFLRAYKKING